MRLKIETTDDVSDIARTRWREIMRGAYQAASQAWHKDFLPLHFKAFSRFRYGYQRRTPRWQQRKKRDKRAKLGGAVDLVFTGVLLDLVTNHWWIRAQPTRATLKMVGPRYVTANYRAHRPHLSNEVTAVTPDEERALGDVMKRHIIAGLDFSRSTGAGLARKRDARGRFT